MSEITKAAQEVITHWWDERIATERAIHEDRIADGTAIPDPPKQSSVLISGTIAGLKVEIKEYGHSAQEAGAGALAELDRKRVELVERAREEMPYIVGKKP